MISTLTGQIAEKIADVVVLDVCGVGYGLFMTLDDSGRLAADATAKVYVYEHIREQSHDLYGFTSLSTKQLFEQLLDVNGVGPRMALNVLSVGNEQAVRTAIAGGDLKFIQQASGVGKRVAERVVVELKDKVGLAGVDLAATGLLQSENRALQDEAVEALVSLGYTPQDAAVALQDIDPKLPTETRVTQALKGAR
ncbi:MAG TPA: Holliday junction branch migration protein RuvA [Candidatus Saccharimonadales bacterium]|nr:Holliday junction branch migration protein RuvA [Candidatus Saccharimonadales bacterium]